jgi:hypothetical protein
MLEKDVFSARRLDQLKYNPELISTEQWGNNCFVPLDIPRYDYPELVSWYFERAKPVYKLKSDIANADYGMTNFDSVDIFIEDQIQEHIWSINPQQEFLNLFPEIVERIYKDFPFKRPSQTISNVFSFSYIINWRIAQVFLGFFLRHPSIFA